MCVLARSPRAEAEKVKGSEGRGHEVGSWTAQVWLAGQELSRRVLCPGWATVPCLANILRGRLG